MNKIKTNFKKFFAITLISLIPSYIVYDKIPGSLTITTSIQMTENEVDDYLFPIDNNFFTQDKKYSFRNFADSFFTSQKFQDDLKKKLMSIEDSAIKYNYKINFKTEKLSTRIIFLINSSNNNYTNIIDNKKFDLIIPYIQNYLNKEYEKFLIKKILEINITKKQIDELYSSIENKDLLNTIKSSTEKLLYQKNLLNHKITRLPEFFSNDNIFSVKVDYNIINDLKIIIAKMIIVFIITFYILVFIQRKLKKI